MVMRTLQNAVVGNVLLKVIGKSSSVKRTTDDRLRFLLLSHNGCNKATSAQASPRVSTDKIGVVCALHQQLRHDGVVVVVLRHVAIGTHFCFVCAGAGRGKIDWLSGWSRRAANGVRHIGAKSDTAQALSGNRLLLNVD